MAAEGRAATRGACLISSSRRSPAPARVPGDGRETLGTTTGGGGGVMGWESGLARLAAGLLIAPVTAPVGVSGVILLLPVQLSVLGVPSPAVTPTNLLFNVVAGPGAPARYHRDGLVHGPLSRRRVRGTLPGVVVGAVIRVIAVPGPAVFRLLVAALLLPLGTWLCVRALRPARRAAGRPSARAVTRPAFVVGTEAGSTASAAAPYSARFSWRVACPPRRSPRPRSPRPSSPHWQVPAPRVAVARRLRHHCSELVPQAGLRTRRPHRRSPRRPAPAPTARDRTAFDAGNPGRGPRCPLRRPSGALTVCSRC